MGFVWGKSVFFSLIIFLCLSVSAFALEYEGAYPLYAWELGSEMSYITYREPGVMRERGVMCGIDGAYTYHNKLMLKAEGRYSYGQVDYKNSGTIDDIDDYILEFRGLAGYDFYISDFFVSESGVLTPYTGIGYRYLNDDGTDKISSIGAWFYERESNYLYSPIGIEFICSLNENWSIGETIEYDIFWQGKQISHLSDVPGYVDVTNKQKKGYGVRGSVKLKKQGEGLDLIIEPFIRYWNIKKSEEKPEGYEPKNNSTEVGVKLAVGF